MRTVYAFLLTSVDGYHADAKGGTEWFTVDDEFEKYSRSQGDRIDTIVMGRVTFEMMAAYWPTPEAYDQDPVVAGFMNDLPKIVASRTMTEHPWGPTTFVADDVAGYVRALKEAPGKDIAIFGSSSLVAALLPTGAVDELRIILDPIALGDGIPVLSGLAEPIPLRRNGLEVFENGHVVVSYVPVLG